MGVREIALLAEVLAQEINKPRGKVRGFWMTAV